MILKQKRFTVMYIRDARGKNASILMIEHTSVQSCGYLQAKIDQIKN